MFVRVRVQIVIARTGIYARKCRDGIALIKTSLPVRKPIMSDISAKGRPVRCWPPGEPG
jgi:hypothetical protein